MSIYNILPRNASQLSELKAQLIVLCKTCRVLLCVVVYTHAREDNSSVGAQLGAIEGSTLTITLPVRLISFS
jgi:hypothetical protein